MRPKRITLTCQRCGETFTRAPWEVRAGRVKYCSPTCHYPRLAQSMDEYFWTMLDRPGPDACWPQKTNTTGRYGVFRVGDKNVGAHRVAYELANGPIPDDMWVRHTCDNPPCCNPAHLVLGTAAENSADMKRRRRSATGNKNGMVKHPERVPRGERSATAKLTEQDVRAIRAEYAAGGVTQLELANRYGVQSNAISRIITRQRWRHVE